MGRLLLIEAEPRAAGLLRRALAAEGFSVESAFDRDRGLAAAGSGAFDIVLLDVFLPGMDGFAVLREILDVRPTQRVLVFSPRSEVEARVQDRDLTTVECLPRPFTVDELIARISARSPDGSDTRFLHAGLLRLDIVRRTVTGTNGAVHLSEREFFVLEALMRTGGRICTRETLLEAAWGSSYDRGANVVSVCVARLRAKLGHEVIETVRNAGYRLQAEAVIEAS